VANGTFIDRDLFHPGTRTESMLGDCKTSRPFDALRSHRVVGEVTPPSSHTTARTVRLLSQKDGAGAA